MPPVIVERIEHITRLTLNRPEKANALDATMVDQLLAAVDQASTDATRLLVLAGADPHLCAGFDFSGIETQSEGDLLLRFVRIEQLLQALRMRFVDSIVPHTEWPELTQTLYAAATALGSGARATLNRLTATDTRDADLADLVRSAAQAGLKTRIQEFRSRSS